MNKDLDRYKDRERRLEGNRRRSLAYYYRNREACIARTKKWREKQGGSGAIRAKNAKAKKGRVCESCGRSDEETYWGPAKKHCSSCDSRGRLNGWCRCGAALYRTPQGEQATPRADRSWRPYCRECKTKPSMSGLGRSDLDILDALWCSPTPGEVSFKSLVDMFGLSVQTARKKVGRWAKRVKLAETINGAKLTVKRGDDGETVISGKIDQVRAALVSD